MPKKVLVSGCFDLLHSGHIEFFQEAARYGNLYVALGSDRTIMDLKGRRPVNDQDERLFVVQNVACVHRALISRGSGMLDFLPELDEIRPDVLVVNEDGATPEKEKLCRERGIQYVILRRQPHAGLQARSTTALRDVCTIPFRIDLAGGWLDQPWVSKYYPGAVLTISIHPTVEFNARSGMASSTRRKAIELWGPRLPVDDDEKLAKLLFCYDNPPGTKEVSGSQDAIGIVFPGLNRAWYAGEYWPERIESVQDESVLSFIESLLYLIPLGPRQSDFSVLEDTRIDEPGARALSQAADLAWQAALARDAAQFGEGLRRGYEGQIAMFPHMVNDTLREQIERYRDRALGWKVSGAGGGGYLILVADKPVDNALRIAIRRRGD